MRTEVKTPVSPFGLRKDKIGWKIKPHLMGLSKLKEAK